MGEKIDNPGNYDEKGSDSGGEWKRIEHEIPFDPEKASRIVTSDSGTKYGEGRNDLDNKVFGRGGEGKRTNSFFRGKRGGRPDPDEFVSMEDLRSQIDESLQGQPEGTTIERVSPPGELSSGELIEEIRAGQKDGASIRVEDNPSRGDIKTATLFSGDQIDSRTIFILGKNGPEISNGLFLPSGIVVKALENYMFVETKEVHPQPTTYISPKEMPAQARENLADRAKRIIPIIALTLSLLLTSFIPSPAVRAIDNPIPDQPPFGTQISGQIENHDTPIVSPEDLQEEAESRLRGVSIGDTYYMPSGVMVHESSDYQYGGANSVGTIGESAELPAGTEYTIQSFSVLDPETHEVVDANVTWKEGVALGDYLQEVSERTGYSVEELARGTKIHIGLGSLEESQIGWVDYSDIITQEMEGAQNA